MGWEPKENIGIIRDKFADERLTKWQQENRDTELSTDHYVKVGFKCTVDGKPRVEHMWVKITKVISKDQFEGTLDNDPVIAKDLKWGQTLTVDRKDIEQHMKE